jgi:hypothetical protein
MCGDFFFFSKIETPKIKLILMNTIIDKTLTYGSETSTLNKRSRKQLKIFERKMYRRILDPVYYNEKENWRILTNREICANVKKLTITETGGKQWQTTPKNLPRIQHARAIPVA